MSRALFSGRLITLEGGEGAGKSSNIDFLREIIVQHDLQVCLTREPGGTPMAEQIRSLLLDTEAEEMDVRAELLLIFAARAQNIKHCIRPALERGEWVLCDRFTDSSYAYQGRGRGLGDAPVAWLEEWIQQGLRPDLCLFFDLPPEQGRMRDVDPEDRISRENSAFHQRVREAYLQRVAADPEHYVHIDASAPRSKVHEQIHSAMLRFWQNK